MTSPAYELASCPVCATSDTEEVATAEDIQREQEALWEFHTRRLRPETPPERLFDRVAFSQRPPLRLTRCVRCGLVYRNPRERAQALHDTYADERPEPAVLDALFETQRDAYAAQAARLTETAGKAGRVVEVGSYVGGFLAAATALGWSTEGVDVNPATNAATRERGFTVHDGMLETWRGTPGLDAVAIWNTFDQLPEPRRTAHRAHELLAPGGLLALRVPNGAFYVSMRRRLDGPAPGAAVARLLLAHSNLLTFPYRHGFTLDSLALLLERTGFAIERVYGDTLVPIADDWTQGWAALEERAVKGALRLLAKGEADAAPWLEIYARKT